MDASTASLLTLPLEIRDGIWKLTVPHDMQLGIKLRRSHNEVGETIASSRDFAGACRQMYREVTAIYYSNTFDIAWTSIPSFRWAIGVSNFNRITSVVVNADHHCWLHHYVRDFPGLRCMIVKTRLSPVLAYYGEEVQSLLEMAPFLTVRTIDGEVLTPQRKSCNEDIGSQWKTLVNQGNLDLRLEL